MVNKNNINIFSILSLINEKNKFAEYFRHDLIHEKGNELLEKGNELLNCFGGGVWRVEPCLCFDLLIGQKLFIFISN